MNLDYINGDLFGIAGKLISCVVSTLVIFRIFDARYIRTYSSKILYIIIRIVCCSINLYIYFLNSPIVNVVFWLLVIIVISKVLYTDEKAKRGTYYFINIALFFICSICESLGGLLVQAGVKILGITQNEIIISFVYTVGGSASLILLYYLVLQRLFAREKAKKIATVQYIIYAIITVYVLVNVGSILFLLQHDLTEKDYWFLLLDGVFVIILNLYLFYLLDIFTDNKELRYKLALYERQAKGNYDYYIKQIESNKKALSVIHDIRKHIRVLENLKQTQISSQLQGYTDSFEEMIEPLLIKQYSDSAILNIIINDKVDYCQKRAIQFEVDIHSICIDFMKPIDVTTIFGNILDNAIEACEEAKERKISLKISPFNGLIYVHLSNTYEKEILWNNRGRPLSTKGEQHGIGLENVEKVLQDYNGNIQYAVSQGQFIVEMMFSKL